MFMKKHVDHEDMKDVLSRKIFFNSQGGFCH